MNVCENCDKKQEGLYASGRFCSKSCASSFSTKRNRAEINEKVRKTLIGKGRANADVKLICPQCKNEFYVAYVKRNQICCSISCSSKRKNEQLYIGKRGGAASAAKRVLRSKNEILFFNLCVGHFSNVHNNLRFFNGWDADIILMDQRIAILWNGKWHYEKITKSHSLEQVQNRDRIKIKEIEKSNFTPYIIKDMGKHNPDFVMKEFNKFLEYIAG